MVRTVIKIDTNLCTGCGLCADACHEGAIGIVCGKAKLLRDDYCDGLGDCLPACPMGAISFEKREALPYDSDAVQTAKNSKKEADDKPQSVPSADIKSELKHWPVQIKLLPVNAAFYSYSDILIAADCTAYAYANFHRDFIRGHVTLIGCPKLDSIDYSEKLGEIFRQNTVRSVTLARMFVPCCGGMESAIRKAITYSGKTIPLKVVTISSDGEILKTEET